MSSQFPTRRVANTFHLWPMTETIIWWSGPISAREATSMSTDRLSQRTGRFFNGSGLLICGASGNQGLTSIAYGGGNYLVAWQDYRNLSDLADVYGARVRAGRPSPPIHRDSASQASRLLRKMTASPSAHDGTKFMVAWMDDRNGTWDILGQYVRRQRPLARLQLRDYPRPTRDREAPSMSYNQT